MLYEVITAARLGGAVRLIRDWVDGGFEVALAVRERGRVADEPRIAVHLHERGSLLAGRP